MENLTLTTPSILFSAISLIMLAYTNRFLSYAKLVRSLKDQHDQNPTPITGRQMENLRKRLYMSRAMQVFGMSSLLLCVICTLLIYVGLPRPASYTFIAALALLIISLWISIREVMISVSALEVHLYSMKGTERVALEPSRPKAAPTAQNAHSSTRPRTGRPRATFTDPSTLGTASAATTSQPIPERSSNNTARSASVEKSTSSGPSARNRRGSSRPQHPAASSTNSYAEEGTPSASVAKVERPALKEQNTADSGSSTETPATSSGPSMGINRGRGRGRSRGTAAMRTKSVTSDSAASQPTESNSSETSTSTPVTEP